jgi:hypothetical protein
LFADFVTVVFTPRADPAWSLVRLGLVSAKLR